MDRFFAELEAYSDFPISFKREQKGEEVSSRICLADLTAEKRKMIQDWLELARRTVTSLLEIHFYLRSRASKHSMSLETV